MDVALSAMDVLAHSQPRDCGMGKGCDIKRSRESRVRREPELWA